MNHIAMYGILMGTKDKTQRKYYAIDQRGQVIDLVTAKNEWEAILKFDAILTPKERMRWMLNDKAVMSEDEMGSL